MGLNGDSESCIFPLICVSEDIVIKDVIKQPQTVFIFFDKVSFLYFPSAQILKGFYHPWLAGHFEWRVICTCIYLSTFPQNNIYHLRKANDEHL